MGFEGDERVDEEMEIRECDPPRTLKVTSHVGPYIWYLDVDLSEADGVTTLAFSQPDLDHEDSLSVGPGWEYYLDRLVAVETGGDLRSDRLRARLLPGDGGVLPGAARRGQVPQVDDVPVRWMSRIACDT